MKLESTAIAIKDLTQLFSSSTMGWDSSLGEGH